MIGESEVADAASLALLEQVVEDAIIDIASVQGIHASTADAVQQVVVDVADLQFLHRVVVHFDTSLTRLSLWREVRELRRYKVLAALMAGECDTGAMLRESTTIGRAGIEVVQPVFNGVVHLIVNHLLVEVGILTLLGTGKGGQSHHAISQQRHAVASLGIVAEGHLVFRRLYLLLVFVFNGFLLLALAAGESGGSGYGSCPEEFQERAARNAIVGVIIVHHSA